MKRFLLLALIVSFVTLCSCGSKESSEALSSGTLQNNDVDVISEDVSLSGDGSQLTASSQPALSAGLHASGSSSGNSAYMESVTGQNYVPEIETELIDLYNQERKKCGLNTLQYDADLQRAARIRAKEIYDNDCFSHTRPDGSEWNTVLSIEVPLNTTFAGENLAGMEYDYPELKHQKAEEWFKLWTDSPPHYQVMTHERPTHIGIGLYYNYENGHYVAYVCALLAAY